MSRLLHYRKACKWKEVLTQSWITSKNNFPSSLKDELPVMLFARAKYETYCRMGPEYF